MAFTSNCNYSVAVSPILQLLCAAGCLMFAGCPDPPASIEQAKVLARKWNPPAENLTREQFFLKRFGEFSLKNSQDCSGIEEFDFDAIGWHASYFNDHVEIEVYLFRNIQPTELDQLRESAVKKIHGAGPHRGSFQTGSGNWKLSAPNGDVHRFFPKNGWLAVFKSKEQLDSISFAEAVLVETTKD